MTEPGEAVNIAPFNAHSGRGQLPQGEEWAQTTVVVLGLDEIGFSEADALLDLGARVHVVALEDSDVARDRAAVLEALDAHVSWDGVLPTCDLVFVGGAVAATSPLIAEALARGVPMWADIDLAWNLDGGRTPWLGVTGPESAQAALALESILVCAGLRTSAVGAGLRPIIETCLDDETYDVLAVRLDATQLHWMSPISFHSACVTGVNADDDLSDVAKVYDQVQQCAVYRVEEPATETMVEEADVVEGARAIGITCTVPAISMLGVVDGLLVDRAFIPQRYDSALELVSVSAWGDLPAVAALAAAALARSVPVPPTAVRVGLSEDKRKEMVPISGEER
ncbi:MAG: hypothetical protein LBN10_10465 [Propionibacteriaceae bacterium]|jgi:UDP-N-acetylmuramoylalanine--D-glutamate ligase|nr:hypothetical protein [Propionibacteriaceae bacterium]